VSGSNAAHALEEPKDPFALIRNQLAADAMRSVSWTSLLAVVLLSWFTIALAVGTIVGHGIAFGTGSDFD
jgi:hypothetical protein